MTKDLVTIVLALGLAACGSSGGGGKSSDAPITGCPTDDTSDGGGGGSETTTGATGGSTSAAGAGAADAIPGETLTSGDQETTYDHFNDPGASGQKDPFELLQEHQNEGPPEIRGRLHSCSKIPYSSLGAFLTSRGVNLNSNAGALPTAGEIYADGQDALGVARYDVREAETYFHTTAGATKLFDIFVQAAPEIIAAVQTVPACQLGGAGKPMFDATDGSCVRESLSCIMGRPATEADLTLCNQMLESADGSAADLARVRTITVAAFLSAAHTCE